MAEQNVNWRVVSGPGSITQTGLLSNTAVGVIKVEASSSSNNQIKRTVDVQVLAPQANVTLGPASQGKNLAVQVTWSPDNSLVDKTITWTSDSDNVVIKPNGDIYIAKVGTANLVGRTVYGQEIRKTVSSNATKPTEITVGSVNTSPTIGSKLTIPANTDPGATDNTIRFEGPSDKVTIAPNGEITFHEPGEVTITVIANGDPTVRKTVTFNVPFPTLTIHHDHFDITNYVPTVQLGQSIDLDAIVDTSTNIEVNSTALFTASFSPDVRNRGVTWSVNNNKATINPSSGLLEGKQPGKVVVKAVSDTYNTVMSELEITIV